MLIFHLQWRSSLFIQNKFIFRESIQKNIKSLLCHFSAQNPAVALHFSHSKSQSPYKRPGRPTRSTLSCPPNCPVSALTSSPTALPFALFWLHKPFCVAPAFALPGVPFPQIVTWLMPSPSSSLHTNVISMQPILTMLFEIVTLPTPLPPGLYPPYRAFLFFCFLSQHLLPSNLVHGLLFFPLF